MALNVLAYNMKRVMAIIGVAGLLEGAGIEYGAWGNWSWKLEYNFMDFGHRNFHFENDMASCECTLIQDNDRDLRLHVVKFGLNYRFGAAPVAAPVAARY